MRNIFFDIYDGSYTLVYSLGWELNPLEDWQGIVENMIERVWRIDKAGVVEKLATEFSDV